MSTTDDYAQFVADSYEAVDERLELGARVVGRSESPLREREGVVVAYDFGSPVVQYPSGDRVSVPDAMLVQKVPHSAPEVGDSVEVTHYDPTHAGECGVVELACQFGRTQVRTPEGRLLAVWASCLKIRPFVVV